jgi:hypothetical protein
VFDFKVDRDAETLLINGYALKLIPQKVRKLNLLAAVIPSDHPVLSASSSSQAVSTSVQSPELVDALNKLERNGLVTADVDLFIMYEGDVRQIAIKVQVIEVEGEEVLHKDLLTAQITVPKLPSGRVHGGKHQPQLTPGPLPETKCRSSDWKCRFSNWLKSFGGLGCSRRPAHHRQGQEHNRPDEYHRHRFHHRPRHGFMRFIISVVVPVLMGAAAGVGIGIISVFIAEIIGGLIVRIRGRREPARYVEIDRKDEEFDDEELLPVYEEVEEAPEYTEEKQ